MEFNYTSIAVNYFTPENEKPFPLTVQRGNNLYNSTTADGSYLFYTTGQKGNYDIWFRDLKVRLRFRLLLIPLLNINLQSVQTERSWSSCPNNTILQEI
ncbi:hypothetical protein LEP1GSC151_2182 [Leptospira interrogans serovar Grippotyphosa str. LT2186]|uniref:WD40-like protein n=1 Tax=Leptospira interrogans serovar Grippotyphosa str. LT2186 TaxID=1001599 RepID=M3IA19_LEPIR|nr:hypothetical protein LEP1GSC151_2182 [Leptospira interrogans serovar Grippotyphosa str. LT2186]